MKQSLSQMIYEELKKKILSHNYSPNELVSEQLIANEFNVSKTPAREALNQLCQEGYVVRYPNFGYLIKELTYKEAQDIMQLRYILESAAAKLVIESASKEEIEKLYDIITLPDKTFEEYHIMNAKFHSSVGKLTGNEYLYENILKMANATARPSPLKEYQSIATNPNDWHTKIIGALIKRDLESAIYYIKKDIYPEEK